MECLAIGFDEMKFTDLTKQEVFAIDGGKASTALYICALVADICATVVACTPAAPVAVAFKAESYAASAAAIYFSAKGN